MPTLAVALLGSLLLWLAQPGAGPQLALWWGAPTMRSDWGLLGWFAPIPWVVLAVRRVEFPRAYYAAFWLAGFVYWLLAIHWIRLPYPRLTPIGWVILAGYFAFYLPVWAWLVRTAARRGAPPWAVAPVAWVALEMLQARLFTGFLMGALSHTQASSPAVIQLASLTGAYGVSALVMLVASALAWWPADRRAAAWGGRVVAAGALAAALLWGGGRVVLPAGGENGATAGPRVALVQGAERAVWEADPGRNERIMRNQLRLSEQAVEGANAEGADAERVDLVVWPESMFRTPVLTFRGELTPGDAAPDTLRDAAAHAGADLRALAQRLDASLLVGADRYDWRSGAGETTEYDAYNSALLADRTGAVVALYDKMHRVPFGEYIPFAKGMPALYFLTPMAGGLTPGAEAVAMPLEYVDPQGARQTAHLAPSICYETVIPHVIRGQVRDLTQRGLAPDLLVNVTNDAWFWGASELDMHLACAVYRAVEAGTPLVVCANTGLSAVIDGRGRVLARSGRMAEQTLVQRVPLRPPGAGPTCYTRYGDWFGWLCLIVCGGLAMIGVLDARRGGRTLKGALPVV